MRTRRNNGCRTLLLALTALLATSAASADHYRVEFLPGRRDDDGALRRARVEVTLTPREGEIGFFRAGADTGLFHQWATFLLEIEAVDAAGKPLHLAYSPHGKWRVEEWRGEEVTLRYTVLLQHDRFPNEPGDDELAAAHPYGVMWTTRALLLEGAPATDITIDFTLPAGWRVSTPWERDPSGAHRFRARNADDLLDAAFLAGEHREVVLPVGEGEARLALGPPVAETEQLFAPLLSDYLGYYSELLEDPPRQSILLIALDASFLGGGVMGRTISLSLDPGMDLGATAPLAAYVIAHEGFHLWTAQWRAAPGRDGEIQWLNEGAADYYAILASRRLGKLDDEAFLARLAEHYGKYLAALRSGKSLVSAAESKLTSQTGYDLVYSGGLSALSVIDLRLRRQTRGRSSADDLLRALHAAYGASSEEVLTLGGVATTAQRELGVDLEDLLRDHVRGTAPLPLEAALAGVGIEIDIAESDGEPLVSLRRAEDAPEGRAAYEAWVSTPNG